jgi:hypothetical protein
LFYTCLRGDLSIVMKYCASADTGLFPIDGMRDSVWFGLFVQSRFICIGVEIFSLMFDWWAKGGRYIISLDWYPYPQQSQLCLCENNHDIMGTTDPRSLYQPQVAWKWSVVSSEAILYLYPDEERIECDVAW